MGQEKRMKYEDNSNNGQKNLKGEESLIVLDQALITIVGLQCLVE